MTTPQKKLTKPIPELRAELLVDKDTLRIAKALKMKIEDYVELVLEYVQNPDKEPEMYIADDEELRKLGYEPRTSEEVNEGLTKILVEGINEELKYADASDLGTPAAGAGNKLTGSGAHAEPIKSRDNLFDLPKKD